MIRSYSDESQRCGSPLLSIAGYIMSEDQFLALDLRWKECLGELPYFHMKEGHHTTHPQVYAALLDCIVPEHVIAGFHVVLDEEKYRKATDVKLKGQSLRYWFGGSYSFCLSTYMALVGDWLAKNLPEEEKVAYFFDAGHARSGEANMFLGMVSSDKRFVSKKQHYRLESYTFIDGKSQVGRVLQSADIIAWHMNYNSTNGHLFYREYLEDEPICRVVLDTLDLEERMMSKAASKKNRL
jgi:hypothetical protein